MFPDIYSNIDTRILQEDTVDLHSEWKKLQVDSRDAGDGKQRHVEESVTTHTESLIVKHFSCSGMLVLNEMSHTHTHTF